MNALNLERCRCIPKNCPGADWRVLLELVAQDPTRELYQARLPAGLVAHAPACSEMESLPA